MKLCFALAGLTATIAIACRGAEMPPEPQIAPAAICAPSPAPPPIASPVIPESPKAPAAAVIATPSAKPQTSAAPGTPRLAQLGERCGGFSPNPKRCDEGLECVVGNRDGIGGPTDAPGTCAKATGKKNAPRP